MTRKHQDKYSEQNHFKKLLEKSGDTWWGNKTPAGKYRQWIRSNLIIRKAHIYGDNVVLEMGCGIGRLTTMLEDNTRDKVIAIDITPELVGYNVCFGNFTSKVSFLTADCAQLPFKDGKFDAIVGNSILHHVDVHSTLKSAYRCLKSGGWLVFAEPNLTNPEIFIQKKIRFIGKYLQNTPEETAFSRYKIARILRNIGFVNVEAQPFDFLHPLFPEVFIKKIVSLSKILERTPFLKEFAGSLIISGQK